MRKKRILYVNDFYEGGGAEKVFRDTYELMQKYYEVDVFYATQKSSKPSNILDYIYSKKYYEEFYKKIVAFKPDIIHLHNYYHKLSPSILSAAKKYKRTNQVFVAVTLHDFHIVCPNSGYRYFDWFKNRPMNVMFPMSMRSVFLRKWDQRGILYSFAKQAQWIFNYLILKNHSCIDTFISPSEFLAHVVNENLQTSVAVVRNPTEKALIPVEFSKKNKNIVFAGRLSEEKGLAQFLFRLSNLKRFKGLFYIAGEGPQHNELDELIKKYNLIETVSFLGYMNASELYNVLNNNAFLVLPSIWHENAPLSLVEASLMNNKILTMSYGGMGEIAKVCGNYIFLDQCSDDELMEFLESDEFEINSSITDIFSAENYKSNLMKLYDQN